MILSFQVSKRSHGRCGKSAPDCRVMLQLVHPGRQVIHRENTAKLMPLLPPALVAYIRKHPEVMVPPAEAVHEVEPTAPSAVYDATFDRTPRALTPEEIEEIIEPLPKAYGGPKRLVSTGFSFMLPMAIF